MCFLIKGGNTIRLRKFREMRWMLKRQFYKPFQNLFFFVILNEVKDLNYLKM
jgi:hypothetical protein